MDEQALSPEELERLRVLRRLTGGRVSDHELLARVRAEVGGGAGSGDDKPEKRGKRRWWS